MLVIKRESFTSDYPKRFIEYPHRISTLIHQIKVLNVVDEVDVGFAVIFDVALNGKFAICHTDQFSAKFSPKKSFANAKEKVNPKG